jgi:hypothetical protein
VKQKGRIYFNSINLFPLIASNGAAVLQALAMKRIRIGRVSMGKLPSGQWKYLLLQVLY